ncbi:nucleotide exchange factor GrpE [Rhodohalobacter barkolensis]|uniref:Protein GrpE n=1 Tax=Rhodohalobacter barkolensis TaxID=2053187 RepID=A0A2N0VLL4_9BACT|nr:nucleotide exchange factor GrpE [Rhodohalobacter barkolensis]PKD45072.1 nucleotide exchange factor GrpE [Rhodohalobacter barkolensis]
MSSKEEKLESAEEQSTVENEVDETSNGGSASIEELDELVEEQQKKINELEEELQSIKDNHLRKAAEMENFKKRLQRERDQVFQKSRESAIEAFLPINDDLRRTLEALEKANADQSFVDGVRLVADKFQDVLERYNVERIDEEGVPFDVDIHDAMLRQPANDDSIESGTVLQVLESGYRIGDKTLRHAKVIVSE